VSDNATDKMLKWVGKVLPGLAPEQTVSGARIHVNSSGTTSVDPGALSEIARRRFREMRPTDSHQVKQRG
jgi:hypothetical protein